MPNLTRADCEQRDAYDPLRAWRDDGWMDLPRSIGDKIAPLIGAKPGEVLVADSTSVNLFKLLGGALRPCASSTAWSK